MLSPDQWNDALHILERNGVVFHCIVGNELLSYPDPVALVKSLNDFHGRYAVYSTFPKGWTDKYLDKCIDAGLYNISAGIDLLPGLHTGDKHVDLKSSTALRYLKYCKDKGVPDVHAAVTIHRHNYDKLEPLFDLCTNLGIWIGVSSIVASADGQHDFYHATDKMQDWLIPADERQKFRDVMYRLAAETRNRRWMMHEPPAYFEEAGDREANGQTWHCSLPILINVEEDGSLRACNYRGGLPERYSVFDLREGGSLTMQRYVELQRRATDACPGCSSGGGAWSYWWCSEYWLKGNQQVGDKVWQTHTPGYEFEKTIIEKI
jgi:MoaA/NifB/PqqE/SkfB family radical SAM enzyme